MTREESFAQIILDDFVTDADDADSTLTWTVIGESDVTVDITDRIATVTANDPEWFGTDVVFFIVGDPGGLQDTVQG